MGVSDKALGGLMLFVASIIFVYYTVWAMFLPFFPVSHPVHDLFPAREWAVRIPAFVLGAGLCVVGIFVGIVIWNERSKKTAKLAVKAA